MGYEKIFKIKLNAKMQSKHNLLCIGGLVNPPYFTNLSKVLIAVPYKLICTIAFVVLLTVNSFAFAANENKFLENKNTSIRTTAFQSLINKFKKKPKNTIEMQDKTPESNVLTLKGSLTMTLQDCEDYLVKHSPVIKNYADIQKAQKSLVGQAKSNYFPAFYGGTGYNIVNTQYSRGQDGSYNGNYYGMGAGVNQLIWDFGRTAAKINMNKYNYDASGYDLTFQTNLSIYNTRLAYAAVLASRANEDIYKLLVRIEELHYQRTKAMFEVGLKSKIDVVNAQYNLTQAKVALIDAQNKYQTDLIALNNTMYYIDAPDYTIKETETFNFQKGYSIKNELDVAYDRKNYEGSSVESQEKDGAILTAEIEKKDIIKTYKLKPYTRSMTDSIKIAYDNRSDLKSMELVAKASEEALKVIKRSYYPAINASAGYAFKSFNDYNAGTMGVYGGVDFPNVNGMNIKYQLDQGKALLDIALNNVDMLKNNIYFQVQTDYVNMKKLEKEIPLMGDEVKQSLENFELADGRYAVGLGDYIELQSALTDYNNAQLKFVKAVFDYNQARYILTRDMGLMQDI